MLQPAWGFFLWGKAHEDTAGISVWRPADGMLTGGSLYMHRMISNIKPHFYLFFNHRIMFNVNSALLLQELIHPLPDPKERILIQRRRP